MAATCTPVVNNGPAGPRPTRTCDTNVPSEQWSEPLAAAETVRRGGGCPVKITATSSLISSQHQQRQMEQVEIRSAFVLEMHSAAADLMRIHQRRPMAGNEINAPFCLSSGCGWGALEFPLVFGSRMRENTSASYLNETGKGENVSAAGPEARNQRKTSQLFQSFQP